MVDERLTQKEFRGTLWRAIVPPLLLLTAHAAVISLLVINWLSANEWSRHSDIVLSQANDLERLFVNMESGVRGFMLTGKDDFLQPYSRAQEQINKAFEDLRNLVSDNQAQLDRLAAINAAFVRWTGYDSRLLGLPRNAQIEDDVIQTMTIRKSLMDGIRSQLHEMIAAESALRDTRAAREQRATVLSIVGSIGVTIILAISLALWNGRTVLRLSQAYQDTLDAEAKSHRQSMELADAVERERAAALASERAARSDLLRSNRMKDEFLATLSHELRTPMMAIMGWARLLRDPAVREKNLDRAISSIDSSAKAQARLIDDLLDMSRIVSGKLALKTEQVKLKATLQTLADSMAMIASAKNVTLTTSFGNGASELEFHGDPMRLQQVITNLLNNAIKFTPSGGSVQLTLERSADKARIIISDSGEGIDPDFLPHVFGRFRQADASTTRRHGGLGLGLAISKHVVELHHGTISAASEGKNRGSTFTVELPLADHPAPQLASPGPALSSPLLPSVALRGKRILVVDDHVESAMIVRTMVEQAGAVAFVTHSAEAALAALNADYFDALVSDIGMPEVDGYELIRRVRNLQDVKRDLPAIAVSAFALPEERRAALEAGYQMTIAKPIAPEEFVTMVSQLLQGNT